MDSVVVGALMPATSLSPLSELSEERAFSWLVHVTSTVSPWPSYSRSFAPSATHCYLPSRHKQLSTALPANPTSRHSAPRRVLDCRSSTASSHLVCQLSGANSLCFEVRASPALPRADSEFSYPGPDLRSFGSIQTIHPDVAARAHTRAHARTHTQATWPATHFYLIDTLLRLPRSHHSAGSVATALAAPAGALLHLRPTLSAHLDKLGFDFAMLAPGWYLTAFQ